MGKVYLIRHGQSTANKQRILQGQMDADLTLEGIEQAQELRKKVPTEIENIYSSPLKRAYKTAQLVYPEKQVNIDDRLMEMDLGILEGKSWEGLESHFRNMWNKISSDTTYAGHGGETGQELIERVISFVHDLENLLENYHNQTVVVFTHFGVIQTIVTQLFDQHQIELPNTGIVQLTLTKGTWEMHLV